MNRGANAREYKSKLLLIQYIQVFLGLSMSDLFTDKKKRNSKLQQITLATNDKRHYGPFIGSAIFQQNALTVIHVNLTYREVRVVF